MNAPEGILGRRQGQRGGTGRPPNESPRPRDKPGGSADNRSTDHPEGARPCARCCSPPPARRRRGVAGGPAGRRRRPGPACVGEPATIVSTAVGGTVYGTGGRDVIFTEGGSGQTIYAYGGDDLICAGAGDTVYAGSGNDAVYVHSSRTPSTASPATTTSSSVLGDLVSGGSGNDTICGLPRPTAADGGAGNDAFFGFGMAPATAARAPTARPPAPATRRPTSRSRRRRPTGTRDDDERGRPSMDGSRFVVALPSNLPAA